MFRPCTIEHMKELSHAFERCRMARQSNCGSVFEKAGCIQWTGLDTEMDYLDFIGRGTPETSDMTMTGMEYWKSMNGYD